MNATLTSANAVYDHANLERKARSNLIAVRAYHKLYQHTKELAPSRVNVTSIDNQLLLTGQTLTRVNRNRIEALANTVPHVKKVFNQIEVCTPIQNTTKMADTWITTKVKAKVIRNSHIDPKTIKVVTENHAVYLLGKIEQQYLPELVDLAIHTSGVNKVVTLLHTYQYTNKG